MKRHVCIPFSKGTSRERERERELDRKHIRVWILDTAVDVDVGRQGERERDEV